VVLLSSVRRNDIFIADLHIAGVAIITMPDKARFTKAAVRL